MSRKLAAESARMYQQRIDSGFFAKYMSGGGLDIGYAGYGNAGSQSILSTAIGIDKEYPGYNGITLPFEDSTQDYVYSSHCLEHINDSISIIQDWFRVLKVNGHLVIIVPHQHLYEKKLYLPSIWNQDHKRFYTPSKLLNEIEAALEPNTYRIRFLEDGDYQFDYNKTPHEHSNGQYELIVVIQKISPPIWKLVP